MASGLLMMVLLGLCSAHQGHDHGGSAERSAEAPGEEDITGTILRMNNGSAWRTVLDKRGGREMDFGVCVLKSDCKTVRMVTEVNLKGCGSSDFFEGDVMLPRTRSAMKCLSSSYSCLWPKSDSGKVEIPYTLSHKYDSLDKKEILGALKDFETKTCIRFLPRSRQTAYLNFEPRYGCSSYVGRNGDKQLVSLQRFGCVTRGIVQHEVMHALGFEHEQNRSDRDRYVKIHWDNIIKYFKSNFEKADTDNLSTPYDYSSIMHYSKDAFGEKWAETITPIPDPNVPIGQRDRLSCLDVLRINRLYKCKGYY